jgi:hypothetical protein
VVFWILIWETVICDTRCSAALASPARDGKHNHQRSHYAYRATYRRCALLCTPLTCDSLDDLLLRLLCNLVGANRQSPVGPDEMAGVAVGISLEIILMLGFGLPEVACRNDFRNDLARPQA